jgi:predicted DNA-binding transcriptional regulator YafY
MNETLSRQWAMLKRIPRAPRKVTTNQLQEHLAGLGKDITIRSIQRDLISLSREFPLVCDEGKPSGWSWRRDASPLSVPGMDAHTALTFALVEAQLRKALPPGTAGHLEPWFEEAKVVIEKNSSSVFNWKNKIRFVSKSMSHLQYEVDEDVRAVVYDCLLKGCQINVTYQAIGNNAEPKKYPVHPLGLVVTDDGIYLLCTIKERSEVTTLHLRRFITAEPTDTPINIPIDFDIDKVASTSFHIKLSEKPIKLMMRMAKADAKRLEEAPVNHTQKISSIDEQWSTVSVTTEDSVHLRRWIQSLGKDVEVLEPKELRAEFLSIATFLKNAYEMPV